MGSLTVSYTIIIESALSVCFDTILPGERGLDGFIEAKDNGSDGDNWSHKMCKAPAILSPSANEHPLFYRPDALPIAQPTVSEH